MSVRGIEYLTKWVHENVNANPYPQENDREAVAYAEKCIEDAAKAGISLEEIEEDMGEVGDYILEAMDEATTEEVNRLAAKDD